LNKYRRLKDGLNKVLDPKNKGKTFEVSLFERKSLEFVVAGMEIVRGYQLHDKTIGKASIKKDDDSLLTAVDRECGEALRFHVRQHFPGIRSNIEDVRISAGRQRVIIYGDPIDGTLPFTVGMPTSTVILGAYNTEVKQVLACTIGEPISGRLWYTHCRQSYAATWDFAAKQLRNERRLHVWRGALSGNTVVYLDAPHGFKRSGRQILTDEQAGTLLVRLAKYRLLLTGSNGLHQAVLAQGNDKMAGAITSAIGGPQDVCGVRLVLNAGGVARAFRVAGNRKLVEEPPHAIDDYDILIMGNNQATVNELSQVLFSLISE
jgi:fructose-1,6-bisphosphatase/inositol monophosphatase family enzyme